jgi:hypothetical protein
MQAMLHAPHTCTAPIHLRCVHQLHPAAAPQDITVPVLGSLSLEQPLLSALNPKAPKRQLNTTLFFAGGICGWRDREGKCINDDNFDSNVYIYSGGVRQKVRLRSWPGLAASSQLCADEHSVCLLRHQLLLLLCFASAAQLTLYAHSLPPPLPRTLYLTSNSHPEP